jgi:hypothetical protein
MGQPPSFVWLGIAVMVMTMMTMTEGEEGEEEIHVNF